MLTAVSFYDDFLLIANKVNNVIADRLLSSELEAVNLFCPQMLPQ